MSFERLQAIFHYDDKLKLSDYLKTGPQAPYSDYVTFGQEFGPMSKVVTRKTVISSLGITQGVRVSPAGQCIIDHLRAFVKDKKISLNVIGQILKAIAARLLANMLLVVDGKGEASKEMKQVAADVADVLYRPITGSKLVTVDVDPTELPKNHATIIKHATNSELSKDILKLEKPQ
ncbi:hypothetical protein DdX_19771 [Ditylenchus destructor]|uniref:Uncharacterized protein n=1 Tax=Ditylenchus destructor TaxID=166010 RepID=A0AAD4MHV5_9BILA|nr:hypothetical protein DdX_19771 [Ditylenchus destructor]